MDSPQPRASGEPITPELSQSTLKFVSTRADHGRKNPPKQIPSNKPTYWLQKGYRTPGESNAEPAGQRQTGRQLA
jgi:hypothetical protein